MRLLFVDRVVRLEKFRSLEAALTLPSDDPLFAFHFPANPMLPASMLIECLAQAGSILLEASTGFTRKAIPGFIRDAKFHRAVRPAHPLRILVEVVQRSDDGALLRGRVEQEGAVSAAGSIGMITAPLSGFYGSEHGTAYRDLYARWLEGADVVGFDGDVLDPLRHALRA